MENKRSFLHKIFDMVWSLFLHGLLTILPITLTIALFNITFKLIVGWLQPIKPIVDRTFLGDIPYAEVLLVIVIIFLIGTVLRVLFLHSLVHALESLIVKIPIIRPVYTGIKQLIHAFSIQDKITFKKVVLVEFPRKGLYSLGFLTSELPKEIAPHNNERFYNVFIPTTPNPTSGYFVMLSEHEITIVDLSRQEAMAMIISGGIIQPDRLSKKSS